MGQSALHRATADDWADVEDRAVYSQGVPACLLELRARVEALEAMQEPEAEAAQVADPQTLHSVALQMVDSLGRSFGILPEILDTLRRAIREPMQGNQPPQPITPPPTELVQQWINEQDGIFAEHIALRAAQWGAAEALRTTLRRAIREPM